MPIASDRNDLWEVGPKPQQIEYAERKRDQINTANHCHCSILLSLPCPEADPALELPGCGARALPSQFNVARLVADADLAMTPISRRTPRFRFRARNRGVHDVTRRAVDAQRTVPPISSWTLQG
jgi:hypothetical protein